MESNTLDTIARWSRGEVIAGDASGTVTTVCTDSRAMKAGDVFLALRGEKFDGHTFVEEAARRGALGAVVDHSIDNLPRDFCLIQVKDTLIALQQMAGEYRQSLSLQVVCITGSNGKTSTKDLVSSVLRERFQITRTEGNLNNHIGLPLTMLRLRAGDQIGVFEIGMNHPGEIAPLAALARPDVAVITNIGVAHIEYMGSREAIAKEKGALVEALPPSGTVVLNSDDEYSRSIAAKTKADAIYCGLADDANIRAADLSQDFNGMRFRLHAFGKSVDAQLPVPGIHMVRNALLAVGVGHAFGMSLEESAAGLANVQPVSYTHPPSPRD